MVKPTIEFGTLELSPFEVRPAHFTPSVAGAFSAEAESETHP
jgi:hypothetical protein